VSPTGEIDVRDVLARQDSPEVDLGDGLVRMGAP